MLLDEDGLNATWERGINISDYLEDLGRHDAADAGRFVPLVFARANDPTLFDPTGMGDGGDPEYERGVTALRAEAASTSASASTPTGDVRVVREMKLVDFRKRLIEHFNILWRQRRVQWPSRSGVVEWAPA